jgi:hypothetical protein
MGTGSTVTDADGQFRLGGLRPTQYLVAINPVSREDGRIQLDFKKEDFEAVDQDWERTWWPGGHDADSATPLRVASGEVVNAGVLAARKGNLYRAKVSASAPSCAAGELLRVFMVERVGLATYLREQGTAPCDRDFLPTGLQPGAWWLELRSEKRPLEARERALVAVETVHKNVEIKTGMGRGVDIGGGWWPRTARASPIGKRSRCGSIRSAGSRLWMRCLNHRMAPAASVWSMWRRATSAA